MNTIPSRSFCCLPLDSIAFHAVIRKLGLLLWLAGFTSAIAQPAALPDPKFWTPDGPVNAILAISNTVYIGGEFSYVGPHTGPSGTFNETTGAPLGSPPPMNGTVKTVVPDGAGGWFIGGTFNRIGTAAITNVAHLNPDLSLDSGWNAQLIGSSVNALAISDGMLFIGGQFTRVAGMTLAGVVGVDAGTGELMWTPQFAGTVNALQIADDLLYVGGNFSSAGSSNRQNLAAISVSTSLATAWNPGADQAVFALAVLEDTVFAGGQFLNAGTKPRNRLVAIDATTGIALTTWNPNPNGIVRALALGAGTVYVGGDFTTISVSSRRGFAAVNSGNGAAQTLDLQLQSASTVNLVRSLVIDGTSLYLGGQFTAALGEPHVLLLGVDITTSTSLPVPQTTAFNGSAGAAFGGNALAVADNKVFIGGDFYSIGGVSRHQAAALSANSGAALSWAPEFDGSVLSLASGTNGIYVGGTFSNLNQSIRARGLAVVDPVNGNAVGSFSFAGTNGNLTVAIKSLTVRSNILYAGGAFTVVSNLPRRFVMALDASTGEPISAFDAKLTGGSQGINSMVLAGENLYLAGDFTAVNGASMSRLTVISAATGAPVAWIPSPSPNQTINELSANATTLYVGGQFSTISGITLKNFAAFGLEDNLLQPIDASLPTSAGGVTTLAASPAAIYVGGTFVSIGGENRQNLACLSTLTAGSFEWNPSPDVAPSVITLSDQYALVGGGFRFMGQAPNTRVTAFFAAFHRSPQTSIFPGADTVQIVTTTGDRTDAVLQATPSLMNPTWTNIETNDIPGFTWTTMVPVTLPQRFFRVIAR